MLPLVAPSCPELHQVAPSCTKVPRVAPSCPELPRVATSCHRLAQVVTSCHKLPQVVTSCLKLSQVVTSCHKLQVVKNWLLSIHARIKEPTNRPTNIITYWPAGQVKISKITFSLFLAFWHIGICLLLIASGQKKVTQIFWIGWDPPPPRFGRIP